MKGKFRGLFLGAFILLALFFVVRRFLFFAGPSPQSGLPSHGAINSLSSSGPSKSNPPAFGGRGSRRGSINKDFSGHSKDIEPSVSALGLEDRVLWADLEGKLVLGPDWLLFFEQQIEEARAMGADNDDAIREHLLRTIYGRLEGDAAREAVLLLDHYLDYQKAREALISGAQAGAPEFGDKLALERAHFGDVAAEKLFGLRGDDEAVFGFLELRAEERVMRAAGAGDEEIQRFRVEKLGQEAAQRLLERDRRRLDWERRVNAFELEINKLKLEGADEMAMREAGNRLIQKLFAPDERVRALAILVF